MRRLLGALPVLLVTAAFAAAEPEAGLTACLGVADSRLEASLSLSPPQNDENWQTMAALFARHVNECSEAKRAALACERQRAPDDQLACFEQQSATRVPHIQAMVAAFETLPSFLSDRAREEATQLDGFVSQCNSSLIPGLSARFRQQDSEGLAVVCRAMADRYLENLLFGLTEAVARPWWTR